MAKVSNVTDVTDALVEVLTDTYRLIQKTHIYHWNVTGPLFYSVHKMTETQYTDMFAASDVLAERIRALGKPAVVRDPGTTSSKDADASLTAEAMVKDLQADNESLARKMRALVDTAEAAEDPVTADLATERAAFHEKTAWMLRATAA